MSNSKRYLEVPFAQKDQAKAFGARWDPAMKKWYIPGGIESAPFAQWMPADSDSATAFAAAKAPAAKPVATAKAGSSSRCPSSPDTVTIAHTAPLDRNFVPYCGEDPPWE